MALSGDSRFFSVIGQTQAQKLSIFFPKRAKIFLHHPVCYFYGNCIPLSMLVYKVVWILQKS